MKKFFLEFAVVLTVLLIPYIFIILPIMRGYTKCFQDATLMLKEISSSNNLGQNEVCKEGKDNIELLNSCILSNKQKNFVAPLVYQLSKAKKIVNSTIEDHNQTCREYQISPIE